MVCTVVLLTLLLITNLLTVRLFGEIEFWFAIIKIVAIVALILVGTGMIIGGFTSEGTRASFAHIWDHGGIFPNHEYADQYRIAAISELIQLFFLH